MLPVFQIGNQILEKISQLSKALWQAESNVADTCQKIRRILTSPSWLARLHGISSYQNTYTFQTYFSRILRYKVLHCLVLFPWLLKH